MRSFSLHKSIAAGAAALCAALFLSACGLFGAKVDTSSWRFHEFASCDVALLLPDGLTGGQSGDGGFSAQNGAVRIDVSAEDQLYADGESAAAGIARLSGRETELMAVNGVELVRLLPSDGQSVFDCYRMNPRGDWYRIRICVDEEMREKRAEALLSAITGTIRAGGEAPAGAIRHGAAAARSEPDYLVLVNRRSALPDGWADELDLVRTVNDLGETVVLERTVCKAFFRLQRALAEENIQIGLRAGYGAGASRADGEASTGLAADLYLTVDGAAVCDEAALLRCPELWAAVAERLPRFGFIVRYPEGGEYDTGRPCEPWHIRFVGAEAAEEIARRGITLERYLGKDPAAIDYLALVNPGSPLPEHWEEEIELVRMTNRHGEEIEVERTACEHYLLLREALLEEGVHLDINSAYRSVKSQEALVKSFTEKYGKAYVEKYVAVPGYSEHHTGLAIDLYLESQAVWGKIHARLADFGFILRYPEGKEAVTGYGYEPWHIRYVGLEAAKAIRESGVTLEEFLSQT